MTDKYCVIGNPVAHSKSPKIHAQFASQTNQEVIYDTLLVDIGKFDAAIELLLKTHQGANVTVPFKEDAFSRCDVLSPRAKFAGAVNTLSFINGQVYGDNTDGIGMVNDILNQEFRIKDKRILVVGAGGAVRGVLEPLLNQAPSNLTLVNRTASKADKLASLFSRLGPIQAAPSFEALAGETFDLIINGTSTSLTDDIPPLPEKLFSHHSLAYDMMYSQQPTVFMLWASNQGANQTLDGKGMLIGQAAESFNIWRGIRPKIDNIQL